MKYSTEAISSKEKKELLKLMQKTTIHLDALSEFLYNLVNDKGLEDIDLESLDVDDELWREISRFSEDMKSTISDIYSDRRVIKKLLLNTEAEYHYYCLRYFIDRDNNGRIYFKTRKALLNKTNEDEFLESIKNKIPVDIKYIFTIYEFRLDEDAELLSKEEAEFIDICKNEEDEDIVRMIKEGHFRRSVNYMD